MRSMAPRPETITERSIADLVQGLCGIPAASFTRDAVLKEIGRTVLDPGSLETYLFFRRSHYTRNLIHRDDLFEVVAIGWEPGQASAIHNHRGQECWMGVPIGRLEVRNYRLLEKDEAARTCRLEPSDRYVIDPRHPAAVDPAEPIHHRVDHFLDLIHLAQVCLERKRLAAEGLDFGRRRFQVLRLAAGDDHVGPASGETKRYRLTDAAAAAGNDRYFSFE